MYTEKICPLLAAQVPRNAVGQALCLGSACAWWYEIVRKNPKGEHYIIGGQCGLLWIAATRRPA